MLNAVGLQNPGVEAVCERELPALRIVISGAGAAGVACAQAIDAACAIHDLPVEPLQKQLEKDDMLIHFDDALVPEDETQAVNGAEKDHM